MNTTTSPADSATPPTPRSGILVNRNFAFLWFGTLISVFGDVIFATTLIVWITLEVAKGQSWAPLAVSGVLLAELVPVFLVGPVAGVFVDRWNFRTTMLVMDAIRTILTGLLLLATNIIPLPFLPDGRFSTSAQLIMIYSIVVLNTICTQFFGPARFALIGDIVPPVDQARASGASQTVFALSVIIAPPIAPILFITLGARVALLVNALSFAFSFLMILAVRPPKVKAAPQSATATTSFGKEFIAGLRFASSNKVISTLLISVAIIMLGAGAVNALDIFFALNNLHAPVSAYGFLSASFGVTALIGAVLAGALGQKIGLVRVLNVSLFMISIGLLIYSRLTSIAPAIIVFALFGIFQGTLNVVLGPLVLQATPRELRGRVMAIINPTVAMAQIAGTIIPAYLASTVFSTFHQDVLGFTFTTYDTIFSIGALITLIGALITIVRLGFKDPTPIAQKEADTVMQAPIPTPVASSLE